jgi:hypothetical protein
MPINNVIGIAQANGKLNWDIKEFQFMAIGINLTTQRSYSIIIPNS